MKQFGKNSMAHENGFNLSLLMEWLDDLISSEFDNPQSKKHEEYAYKLDKHKAEMESICCDMDEDGIHEL